MPRFLWISAVLILGVALTGCAAAADPSPSEPRVHTSVPSDWSLTDEDWDAAYSEAVHNIREMLDVGDEVEFTFVRWVSAQEWPEVQVSCISDAGFEARVNNGGMLFGDVPEGQASALNEAVAKCEASYPIDARTHMTLPLERAKAEYEYYAKALRSCVEKLGYTISEPPSQQTWLDGYYSGGATWSPYEEAISQAGFDEDAQNKIWSTCSRYSDAVYPPL